MSFLAKIEQACAVFIERTFAKTFPSDLEPAHIARKLVATMEARTRGEEGHWLAPGFYAVYVSRADFDRLAEHRPYLEREWAALLRDLAGRVGITFAEGDSRVVMLARARVPVGAVEIEVMDETDPAVRFALRMVKGVPAHGVYAVEGKTRIGRSEESEIVLVDLSASRAHAVVDLDGGQAVVHDLGSTNGTYVNGERVAVRALRDGDELRFGNTIMRFVAKSTPWPRS